MLYFGHLSTGTVGFEEMRTTHPSLYMQGQMSDVEPKGSLLLYTVLGGTSDPHNIAALDRMASLMLQSAVIQLSSSWDISILIMCNISVCDRLHDSVLLPVGTVVLPLVYENIPAEAARSKMKIFAYEKVADYDLIMFLDADMVITRPFDPMPPSHDLIVAPRPLTTEMTDAFVSMYSNRYTASDLTDRGWLVCSCLFAFRPTPFVGRLFDDVLREIHVAGGFYEQSAMNDVLHLHGYDSFDLFQPDLMLLHAMKNTPVSESILHYCGAGVPPTVKLMHMITDISKYGIM